MQVHNIRSPQQWEIISGHVNFEGMNVIDLGCGYGDLLRFIRDKGEASYVLGVDQEIAPEGLPVVLEGLESYTAREPTIRWNVALCSSVLPYLPDATASRVLSWMYKNADIALVECQYDGDGPGPAFLRSDKDMKTHLREFGWTSVEAIGKTLVEGRDKHRTIWMCTKGE